ncbi:20501_t:CDS:2 [Gigaspora rosea]|nr:20501_t:CDS:2 [Gigaspora rosea]
MSYQRRVQLANKGIPGHDVSGNHGFGNTNGKAVHGPAVRSPKRMERTMYGDN